MDIARPSNARGKQLKRAGCIVIGLLVVAGVSIGLSRLRGESVMDLVAELHRAGATICMVTHDPRYARHAERSIHLFDDRVVEAPVEMEAVV